MTDLVPDVLRHRLVLSLRGAWPKASTPTPIVQRVMAKIPVPDKPLARMP